MFQEPMLPIRAAPTTETMPVANNAATIQNAPTEVNTGVVEAANNASVFFYANDPTNPKLLSKLGLLPLKLSLVIQMLLLLTCKPLKIVLGAKSLN